jgi:hypothetical protein
MPFFSHYLSRLLIGLLALVAVLGISIGETIALEAPTTYNITTLKPEGQAIEGEGWTVTSKSSKSEMALAAHLQKFGAKVYGAWWCPHCYEQKQLFGREAIQASFGNVAVECHEQGINPQVELCQQKKIEGYPTWIIKGKKYPGITSPKQLAKLTGYRGPQKFKYLKLLAENA